MNNNQLFGTPFQVTATNATSSVATQSAVAGTIFCITDISGSSDLSGAKILVKDGTTVIYQQVIGATAFYQQFETPLRGTKGNAVSVTVNSTSIGTANIAGYSLADA
jgi:hypothetical protein